MIITIFTPLYNRAKFLKRIYESLSLQKDFDIEWVIVDDGSVDNPSEIIDKLKQKSSFPILFVHQKNKGKHFAINKGLSLAKGELFFILDSDDFLPQDAIKKVRFYFKKIKDKKNISGVAGRRMDSKNTIIGNGFKEPIVSNSLNIRYQYNITGDLVEFFKNEFLKKYLFPE
jgi:glycosyltransferase involved in cell wall biosynthesis